MFNSHSLFHCIQKNYSFDALVLCCEFHQIGINTGDHIKGLSK